MIDTFRYNYRCVLKVVIILVNKIKFYAMSGHGTTGSSMPEGEEVERQVKPRLFVKLRLRLMPKAICFRCAFAGTKLFSMMY